jgi:putative ABC transport system substrate-binding protein
MRLIRLVVLALGVLAAPLAADAQQTGRVYRLGFLSGNDTSPLAAFLIEALRKRGWTEGQDFILERRSSGQNPERAVRLAKELVEQGVDLIITQNTSHALAARQATSTVPIIMFTSGFPIEAGLAASLARPGGNVTGLSIYTGNEIFSKHVDLLRELVPSMRELGVVWDYAPPAFGEQEVELAIQGLRRGARAANIKVRLWMVRTDNDLTDTLSASGKAPINALFVTGGPINSRRANAPRITTFALRRRLPTITDFGRTLVDAGGLLSYSPDLRALADRTASFIERILRGAKPTELPIELPTKFELVINMKTAKALGLTIPQTLLLRADHVIE